MVRMPHDETEADVLLRRAHGDAHARPRPTLYIVPQRAYMPTGSLLEQIHLPVLVRVVRADNDACVGRAGGGRRGGVPRVPAPRRRRCFR